MRVWHCSLFGFCVSLLAGCADRQTALLSSATAGDAEAQYEMAKIYAGGIEVEQNHEVAFDWYQKAADQGHAAAQNCLGQLYDTGQGVEKSDDEAVKWFRKSAEQGWALGEWNLGRMYETGQGVEQDWGAAMSLYQQAIAQGLAEAQYSLGEMYCGDRVPPSNDAFSSRRSIIEEEGREWIAKAASQNLPRAQYRMGEYLWGTDDVRAIEWIRKAAEARHPEAQFRLGQIYEHGHFVTKSLPEAIYWYEKSAAGEFILAQFRLAEEFAEGYDVPQELDRAESLLLRAAEVGNPEGEFKLGMFCLRFYKDDESQIVGWKWIRKAAQQGYPPALRKLGEAYETGEGMSQDSVIATRYYVRALEAENRIGDHSRSARQMARINFDQRQLSQVRNSPYDLRQKLEDLLKDDEVYNQLEQDAKGRDAEAQLVLGLILEYGTQLRKQVYIDPVQWDSLIQSRLKEAGSWLQKSAEQGNAIAQYRLAKLHERGRGLPRDGRAAVKWYREAAAQGVTEAKTPMEQIEKQINQFQSNRKAAEQGDANAQFQLAAGYLSGYCVEKNVKAAIKWFTSATERGNVNASYELGQIYDRGIDIAEDNVKALDWYQKAAESGQQFAQIRLGQMYEKGDGAPADLTQAIHWYRKAANAGQRDAQLRLGQMYDKAEGVEEDPIEAFKWYQKAAEYNLPEACLRLAEMLYEGRGVEQNYKAALEWLQKTSGAPALYRRADMYYNGQGVERDLATAVDLYREAVKQRSPEACYKLATLYQKGEGVEQSLANAISLYRTAAELGHEDAKQELKRLGK